MLDYRNIGDRSEGVIIHCDSCGQYSRVSLTHGRYCPYCGPDTITPITITYPDSTKEMLKKKERAEAEPCSDAAFYKKMDEMRKEDILDKLREEYGDIPEERWDDIAARAVPILEKALGFNDAYWEAYWETVRYAIREAKNYLSGSQEP